MKKLVKFTKSHKNYTRGDIAGFDPLAAKALIDGKVAVAYEAKVKTNEEDRPEGFADALKALEVREAAVASAEGKIVDSKAALLTDSKALDKRDTALGKSEKAVEAREVAIKKTEDATVEAAAAAKPADAATTLPGQGAKTPAVTK